MADLFAFASEKSWFPAIQQSPVDSRTPSDPIAKHIHCPCPISYIVTMFFQIQLYFECTGLVLYFLPYIYEQSTYIVVNNEKNQPQFSKQIFSMSAYKGEKQVYRTRSKGRMYLEEPCDNVTSWPRMPKWVKSVGTLS